MDAELRPRRNQPLERAGENVDACGIAHRDGVVELSRDAVVFQRLAGVIIKLVAVAAVRGTVVAYTAVGKSQHGKPARLNKSRLHNRKRRGDDLMTLVQTPSASAHRTTAADESQCVQRERRFKTSGTA